tara:strand:+ start:463 stop:711 length:249 start_codon:yes stop_codon:yes gene_type:complete
MKAVSRDKRKMKGIWFDLYGEYKTKEEANKKAKEIRSQKKHLVRVVRDYYWTDNTKYYLYTKEIEKRRGINFFDNLFDYDYS